MKTRRSRTARISDRAGCSTHKT